MRFDPVFFSRDAKLVEARDVCGRERFEPEFGERLTAPEVERRIESRDRRRVIARDEVFAAFLGQPLEAHRVDRIRIEPQPISGRLGHQHCCCLTRTAFRFQYSPQVRHVGLQRAGCRVRRRLAPQQIDETIE
jgi:hypothetical protein